jgi:hypothetical protein
MLTQGVGAVAWGAMMLRGFMLFADLLLVTFALTLCPLTHSLQRGAGVNHHILMDFFLESQKRKEKVGGDRAC